MRDAIVLGNLRKNSLEEIFTGETYTAFRRAWWEMRPGDIPFCNTCQIYPRSGWRDELARMAAWQARDVRGRKVIFWGAGEAYRAYKSFFADCEPVAMLVESQERERERERNRRHSSLPPRRLPPHAHGAAAAGHFRHAGGQPQNSAKTERRLSLLYTGKTHHLPGQRAHRAPRGTVFSGLTCAAQPCTEARSVTDIKAPDMDIKLRRRFPPPPEREKSEENNNAFPFA